MTYSDHHGEKCAGHTAEARHRSEASAHATCDAPPTSLSPFAGGGAWGAQSPVPDQSVRSGGATGVPTSI